MLGLYFQKTTVRTYDGRAVPVAGQVDATQARGAFCAALADQEKLTDGARVANIHGRHEKPPFDHRVGGPRR